MNRPLERSPSKLTANDNRERTRLAPDLDLDKRIFGGREDRGGGDKAGPALSIKIPY